MIDRYLELGHRIRAKCKLKPQVSRKVQNKKFKHDSFFPKTVFHVRDMEVSGSIHNWNSFL